MVISSKKLLHLAKRWMRNTGVGGGKRIFSGDSGDSRDGESSTSLAGKGHFAVYTGDGKRFTVPLTWLGNDFFCELLKMSEDEFGLPGHGPITLPFDGTSMEEVAKLMRRPRRVSADMKEALMASLASHGGCSSPVFASADNQQRLVC